MKVGRNEPCPCGSGKKFKRCHGGPMAALQQSRSGNRAPSSDELELEFKRRKALEFQRTRQQGRGRPIISAELNGTRFVAIGKKVAYGKWRTFLDFLLPHIVSRFGRRWIDSEKAKPELERHPFVHWLDVLNRLMLEHATDDGDIHVMPEYGAARAVFGLAYDLYLIEHHSRNETDESAFERLLERLRHPEQFFGARNEVRIAGFLLRAGFDLSWEDEQDRRPGGHCEFVATFPQTGRAFWVECKMRQPEIDAGRANFTHLVSAALQKETQLERLIFVELNLLDARFDSESGGWSGAAINQLRALEKQPNAAELPPALVVVTNFPEHRQLDKVVEGAGALIEGFKTERYRFEFVDLHDAIEERDRNPEIETLWRSMQEHSVLPSTFDGSIPGLDESQRLLIGNSYVLPGGEIGILEEATVNERERKAAAILSLGGNRQVLVEFHLSNEEVNAWKRYPETFFGEVRPHHPPAADAMDLFTFFAKAHAATPRQRLLELMGGHADVEKLHGLSQPELVKRYAYALTANVAQRHGMPPAPAWHSRLKRRLKTEKG